MNSFKENLKFAFTAFIIVLIITECSPSPRFGTKTPPETGNTRIENIPPASDESKRVEPENPSPVLASVEGIASYYAHKFNGRQTASGEIYDMYGLTAAHPTYPMETIMRVTNLNNGRSVVIRINDRMPKHPDRIIDLSYGSAMKLDMLNSGLAKVRLDILKWGK